MSRWHAEKYCEHKFASLLSETKGRQRFPAQLLQSDQVRFPVWLNERETSKRIQPRSVLVFENRTDTKYAKLLVNFPSLAAVTACAHIQWDGSNTDSATIFSYAVPKFFNEFQLRGMTDEGGFVRFAIIVHEQHSPYSPVFRSDGQWHHFCVTWQKWNGTWAFYADGKRKVSSTKLSASKDIIEGGTFIVGQDQDSFGGTFKEKESFSGNITDLNVWSKVLSDDQIERVRSCSVLEQGVIFGWGIHRLEIEPTLQETNLQFVCPGNSEECQILQAGERGRGYTPCLKELPFVCHYTQDVYERLRNTIKVKRGQTFSSRVNTIANRTLITGNILTSDVHTLNVSAAAASLSAIEQVMDEENSTVEPADLLSIIQFLKEVVDIEVEGNAEALEDLSHHFVQVAGALLEQRDAAVWSEVNPVYNGHFIFRCGALLGSITDSSRDL
ncbi:hypothetical protein FKM82_029441 [Ascaphus truei]